MSQAEVGSLFRGIAMDHETNVGAMIQGLECPVSLSDIILADVFDAQMMSAWSGKGKKPKPYDRHWIKKQKKGKVVVRTKAESQAYWEKRGYQFGPEGLNRK